MTTLNSGLRVLLPDATALCCSITDDLVVSELLQLLLVKYDRRLRRKSGKALLVYNEWRLAQVPKSLETDQRWTKRELALFYKPLDASVVVKSLKVSSLILVHVLSTVPVHLINLPHAPATIVSVPILATMTTNCLKDQIEKLIGLPKLNSEGQTIEYSYELSPQALQHGNLQYLEKVILRSNAPSNSWLSTSLSRPTSYVATWLNHAVVDDRSSQLKKKISAPLPSANDVPNTLESSIESQRGQKSMATSRSSEPQTSSLEQFSEEQFIAFLDDLQIPEQKRASICALSLEKRASLLHLDSLYVAQKTPKQRVLHSARTTDAACAIAISSVAGELERSAEDLLSNDTTTVPGGGKQQSVRMDYSPDKTPVKVRVADDPASSKTPIRRNRSRSPVRLNMSTCPPTLDWNRPKSPLKSQGTGSSWITSWWSKADDTKESDPQTFVHRLNSAAIPACEKIAELVRLRVQLGTARASWITLFMSDDGLATLARTMSISAMDTSDSSVIVLFELLKCFRALLNTQASYKAIVENPEVLRSISRSARYENPKVQTLAFDLLSGLCASSNDAHKIIFTSLCTPAEDVRGTRLTWLSEKAFGIFRTSTNPSLVDLGTFPTDSVRAALSLVNTVCNAWNSVEDRIALRNELLLDIGLDHLTKVSQTFPQDVVIQLDLLKSANDDDYHLLRRSLASSTHTEGTMVVIAPEAASACHCLSIPEQDIRIGAQENLCDDPGDTSASTSLLENTQLEVDRLEVQVRSLQNELSDLKHDTKEKTYPVAQAASLPSPKASQDRLEKTSLQSEHTSLPCDSHQHYSSLRPTTTNDELASAVEHDFGFSLDTAVLPSLESSLKLTEANEDAETFDAKDLETCAEMQHKAVKVASFAAGHHKEACSRHLDISTLYPPTATDPTKRKIPIHKENYTPIAISMTIEDGCMEEDKLPRGRGLHRQTFSRALSDVSEASSRAVSDSVVNARHNSDPDGHISTHSRGHLVVPSVQAGMAEDHEDQFMPIAEVSSVSDLNSAQFPTDEPLMRSKDVLSIYTLPPPPPPPPIPPPPPRLPINQSTLTLKRTTIHPPVLHSSRRAPISSKPLKPVFWDKLEPGKIAQSVWLRISQRIDNGLHQELMLSDFERYFCKEITMASRPMLTSQQKTHVRKVILIEHRRAKNMEVMLARIKIPHAEIRKALISMDDSRLGTLDQLKIMQENCPTEEETQLVGEFVGETTQLGNAELYIREVGQVPHLYARIQSMIFRRSFDLEATSLLPDLETLHQACLEILNCQDLQDFFALALTAGNILNAATFRGDAQGFRLEGLMKLADVRSVAEGKSGATLLHYLVAVAEKKHKKPLRLSEKLAHCASANRISWENARSIAGSFKVGLTVIRSQIEQLQQDTSGSIPGDQFLSQMTSFVDYASPIVEGIAGDEAQLSCLLEKVLTYFGEGPYEMQIGEVFSTLTNFVDLVDKASEDNTQLSNSRILRTKTNPGQCSPSTSGTVNNFDGTLRAIRSGKHGREKSSAKDRPASRVFSFQ